MKKKTLVPLIIFLLGICLVGLIVYKIDSHETEQQHIKAQLNATTYGERIKNEITNGMLDIMPDHSTGETYKDTWGNAKNAKILCGYLKAGIKAVRECTPKALVTLHLESMGYGKCSEIKNQYLEYAFSKDQVVLA